jgi:oleandomycin transport system ATP-binding protein
MSAVAITAKGIATYGVSVLCVAAASAIAVMNVNIFLTDDNRQTQINVHLNQKHINKNRAKLNQHEMTPHERPSPVSAICQPRQRQLRPLSAPRPTLSIMTNSIQAEGLTKRFGPVTAVDGIDMQVKEGTVFGLLGPNGAGKTTTVHILATLVTPDEGHATVAGYDVKTQAHQVRQLIGLAGQYASVDEMLTGTENLVLLARLTGQARNQAKHRAKELLEQFRLEDAAGRAVKTYSGGMRRRLDLAASLVNRPSVLFLDEPTTGLDPRSRNDMWNIVRELTTSGVTVLLTTQYLEEADQLAEQIAVIDHGRMIATGTPQELKASTGSDTLDDVFLALTGHEIKPAAHNDLEEALA